MKKFHVSIKIVEKKYVGIYAARSEEDAKMVAEKDICTAINHHCHGIFSNPEYMGAYVEEIK